MARTFLATSVSPFKQTITSFARKVLAEGALTLYKGYCSSLLSIALFRGTFFGFYDTLKTRRKSLGYRWAVAYLAGALAGIAVHPVETVRKNMVLRGGSTYSLSILRGILREKGVKGLFRGCSLIPLQSMGGAYTLICFDQQLTSQEL
jgi:solute carrier family 25 (adenine nucleotide translocator) protein 4/5/6/31